MNKSEKQNIKKQLRMLQPIIFHDKKQEKTIELLHQKSYKVNDKELLFPLPNNITLCMNISNSQYDIAKESYYKILKPLLDDDSKIITCHANEEFNKIFDYIENIQVSLIFIYTAVEAFCNISIPADFTFEKINNKKVKEEWNKENIERWTSTSEKLGSILPSIYKINPPSKQKFWTQFKKLEEIRNDIIHQKTIKNDTGIYSEYYSQFFDVSIFEIIRSGFLVIDYFCKNATKNEFYFPLGIRSDSYEIIEVDDINDVIEPIYANDDE